eukprot:11024285-Karenia_brevis.AAC.1
MGMDTNLTAVIPVSGHIGENVPAGGRVPEFHDQLVKMVINSHLYVPATFKNKSLSGAAPTFLAR